MFMILLAAQAAAVSPAPQAAAAKPKQVCELREVTGSRSKRRVCRDATGRLDLGPGVRDATGDATSRDGANSSGSTPN